MRCERCHRTLTREPVWLAGHAYGPKCKAILLGSMFPAVKPVKPAQHIENEKQPDLFPGSLLSRAAAWVASWWNDVTEPGIHL